MVCDAIIFECFAHCGVVCGVSAPAYWRRRHYAIPDDAVPVLCIRRDCYGILRLSQPPRSGVDSSRPSLALIPISRRINLARPTRLIEKFSITLQGNYLCKYVQIICVICVQKVTISTETAQ